MEGGRQVRQSNPACDMGTVRKLLCVLCGGAKRMRRRFATINDITDQSALEQSWGSTSPTIKSVSLYTLFVMLLVLYFISTC